MTSDSTAPDEAFAVLGDASRVAILRALFDDPYEPKTFSELRDAAGIRDSGQFNYHLDRLVGRFVRKTDEGYHLRLAGWQVIGAVLSGAFAGSGRIDPVAYDHPCPECGGTVVATYEDERMRVVCEDCEEQFSSAGIPPGALEGFEREELPRRFDHYMRGLVGQARLGICISCSGRMDPGVVTEPSADLGVEADNLPMACYRCRRCPEVVSASVGSALLDHPAVAAFHWERGIDIRAVPSWTLGWLNDDYATVESEEPLRVRVSIELDGDTLDLVMDEALEVVEIE